MSEALYQERALETLIGDIFELAMISDAVVVPTNIGWTSAGKNVMGAGVARQAKRRYPGIDTWWGLRCMHLSATTPTTVYEPRGERTQPAIVLFPTKPLDADAPHLSWRNKACLYRISWSMQILHGMCAREGQLRDVERVLVPLVGCGNGGLQEGIVLPVLSQYWHNKMRLVRQR